MRTANILLMYPPGQFMADKDEKARPDGGLGLLYVDSSLGAAGIQADLVDASVGTEEDTLEDTFYREVKQENGHVRVGMSWERIRELIARKKYDIVGIHSNFTFQTKMALKVAEIAKSVNPEIVVVAGGVNARALPNWFFRDRNVDLICTTEGERVVVDIARRWMARQSLQGIPGTMFCRENGEFVDVPLGPETVCMNLDELPIPSWHKLPFPKYDAIDAPPAVPLVGTGLRYANIMTSRGCPYECKFCHISREKKYALESGNIGKLRVKTVPRVLYELDVLRSLGVRRIFIEDDSLLAHKPRVQEIFRGAIDKDLTMLGINGVNLCHIFKNVGSGRLEPDRDYLELFASAGFRQITFPVESGSQRVLDKYAPRKLDLEKMDVIKLVRVAREVGIVCPINMMIGFPDETVEEMMQSVLIAYRLIHEAGAPHVSFSIVIPFPGSSMHDSVVEDGYLSKDFDPDDMNWKHAIMTNTTVPREMVEQIRDAAWSTVNHPAYIQRRLQESIGAHRFNL